MTPFIDSVILEVVRIMPQVIPHLSTEFKSQPYFLARVQGLVRGVYDGYIGGEFVDIMQNLIKGQMNDAYLRAWSDQTDGGVLPSYLNESLALFTLTQTNFDWIYQFYKDIIDARVDQTSIEPLLTRAGMWANRWNDAYNEATRQIALEEGYNMQWVLGEAEHCTTCLALSNIVAKAKEWEQSGWRPQSQDLECHGYNCKCSLEITDKRRTPKALARLLALR